MIGYKVFCEASGYGDVEAEVEALVAALDGSGAVEDMAAQVLADDAKGMLLVILELEAADARDAYQAAYEVWMAAWDEAFPEQAPPSRLMVKCLPAVEVPA